MLDKLIKWINVKTGYRYWFQVKFIYKDKSGREVFHYFDQVGLTNINLITQSRVIKKILRPLHTDKTTKKLLHNGNFHAEPQAYLGYFKHKIKKQLINKNPKQK